MRASTQCLIMLLVSVMIAVPAVFLGMTRKCVVPSDPCAYGDTEVGSGPTHTERYMRDSVDDGRGPPLLRAVVVGYHDEAARLLSEGADPEVRDERGWRPLHYAASASDWEMVSLLLRHGADVQARTDAAATALHIAAVHSRSRGGEICDGQGLVLLTNAGLDVDARSRHGMTPLHVETRTGRLDHAEVLIRLGADVNARDNAGLTPLAHAKKWDKPAVVQFLRSVGATE